MSRSDKYSVFIHYSKTKNSQGQIKRKILSIFFSKIDSLDLEDIDWKIEDWTFARFLKLSKAKILANTNQIIISEIPSEVRHEILRLFWLRKVLEYDNDNYHMIRTANEVYEKDILIILQKYCKGIAKYRFKDEEDEKWSDWKAV